MVRKWTVLSAGMRLCWCHFLCTHCEGAADWEMRGNWQIDWRLFGRVKISHILSKNKIIYRDKCKAKYSIIQCFISIAVIIIKCHLTFVIIFLWYTLAYWISVQDIVGVGQFVPDELYEPWRIANWLAKVAFEYSNSLLLDHSDNSNHCYVHKRVLNIPCYFVWLCHFVPCSPEPSSTHAEIVWQHD